MQPVLHSLQFMMNIVQGFSYSIFDKWHPKVIWYTRGTQINNYQRPNEVLNEQFEQQYGVPLNGLQPVKWVDDLKLVFVLFLTEEAYSHGGLQTRELGQTPLC